MDRGHTLNRYAKMLQDCCAIARITRIPFLLRPYFIATITLAGFGLIQITALRAQERVRTAAQRLKIESFKNPEALFRIGPLEETLTGSAGFEFTDNSQLANTDKISRASFYEALDLHTRWILSHLNQIEFNFGAKLMEDFYGDGKSRVAVGISPDSDVELQFSAGDFLVRVFDRFSYVQDPTSNPAATNTAYLNRLTNIAGTVIDVDLNLAIVSFSADYTYQDESGSNVAGQTNQSATGNRNTFRAGSTIGFRYSPKMLYGLETSLSRSTGGGGGNSNASGNVNSLSVGPFIRGALSRLTDLDLGAGVNLIDTKPSIPLSYYYAATVRHQINRNWQFIFSARHDLIFTTGTDITEETSLRIASQLNLTRFITFTVGPSISFDEGKSSTTQGIVQNGTFLGDYKAYDFRASLTWKPRRHLVTTLGYDFRRRDAADAAGRYTQNSITLNIGYVF
jgi:hypothetical protein